MQVREREARARPVAAENEDQRVREEDRGVVDCQHGQPECDRVAEDQERRLQGSNREQEQLDSPAVEGRAIFIQDKAVLLEKYQEKEKEYNLVLANCIRDKNMLAEKLNHLN